MSRLVLSCGEEGSRRVSGADSVDEPAAKLVVRNSDWSPRPRTVLIEPICWEYTLPPALELEIVVRREVARRDIAKPPWFVVEQSDDCTQVYIEGEHSGYDVFVDGRRVFGLGG